MNFKKNYDKRQFAVNEVVNEVFILKKDGVKYRALWYTMTQGYVPLTLY